MGTDPEKTITERDTCAPLFAAALFTACRTWKQPRCPWTDEWIQKFCHIYTMQYYSAIIKSPRAYYTEQSKSKEKKILYSNACVWNLER